MGRFRQILLERQRDERGVSLVEVVIAMTLFFVIGGSFVYATTAIEASRKQSLDETKSTLTKSSISNSFRDDLNSAKGIRLDSASVLLIARSDGKCVSWKVTQPSGVTTKILTRTTVQGAPASGAGSVLASGLSSASLSLTGQSATITTSYGGSDNLSEQVPLRLSGSDGGVCW